MKVQALDKKGIGKDLEYLPNSLCGNSYYSTELDPNHYWKFVTTVYDGDFKTKFRIMLSYIDPNENPKKQDIIEKI